MENIVIDVQNISKIYNNFFDGIEIIALEALSLQVQENTFTLLTGSNGIGKTTLMNILAGLIQPTSGNGKIFDINIKKFDNKQIIGYAPDLQPKIPNISISDFFTVLSSIRKTEKEKWLGLVKLFQMEKWILKPLHWLSIGMLKRISLISAFFHDPKLILLDEPLENLDNNGKETLAKLIEDRLHTGATILMTSHIIKEEPLMELKPNYLKMEDLFVK